MSEGRQRSLPTLPEGTGRYDHLSDFDYFTNAYDEDGGSCLECQSQATACHLGCAPYCSWCEFRTEGELARKCQYCSEPLLDPQGDSRVPKAQQKWAIHD